ncbi:MAG: phosphatase PAP2-related protein [Arcicella sp.]|nr:phosphatase PAP2-related protein [Arcicella sp.]
MQESYNTNIFSRWKTALSNYSFTVKLLVTIAIFIVGALQFPTYFSHIQKREGRVLNDYVLNYLPAQDVSTPIFAIIYGLLIYMLCRVLTKPNLFLLFALTFVIETVFRMTTIYLFPLNQPQNLVILHDIFSELLIYGDSEPITKDLFFSGHTATMVMIWLFVEKPLEKIVARIATIILASLLLIQHVHYTIDVFGAFFFTYLSYLIAKQIVDRKWFITVGIMIGFYAVLQTVFYLGLKI